MGLKDLREKFHDYDAKVSSKFHKDNEGLKKPSWGKIILLWLGLIILLILISSTAYALFTVDVDQEVSPVSSVYALNSTSHKSDLYYTVSNNDSIEYAYQFSYVGKLKLVMDTSDISHSDYFERIMDSYVNGANEYNASVDFNLTAYDSNGKKINTDNLLKVAEPSDLTMRYTVIDLLFTDNIKVKFKEGILTLISKDNANNLIGNRLDHPSSHPLDTSLKNVDYIVGVMHVFNKNAKEPSDPNFYSYTLHFKIPKSAINVKMS